VNQQTAALQPILVSSPWLEMPPVQSGSPPSSCLTTPTNESSLQSGTKKKTHWNFRETKAKRKNGAETHALRAIVADKVQQIEKEDDFDACKLRGMPAEQRTYAEKLKNFFFSLSTGMQLRRSSQLSGHAITRWPQRYSCSRQQVPSVAHQSRL
jgi:hypothetical protein